MSINRKTEFVNGVTPLNAENLNNIFIEPPKDGHTYARANGEWMRVVNVEASILYGVNVQSLTNGTVSLEYNQACEGDEVSFTVIPNSEECVILSVSAAPAELSPVFGEVNKYRFTMPAGDVVITAEITRPYAVGKSATVNGAITLNKTSAEEGEEVTFTVTPNTGYKVNAVTISGAINPTYTDGQDGARSYTFTMPAEEVTIGATFAEERFNISIDTVGIGSGSQKGSGTAGAFPMNNVRYGTQVTLECRASVNCLVGAVNSSPLIEYASITTSDGGRTAHYVFDMPYSDVSFTVNFVYVKNPIDIEYD